MCCRKPYCYLSPPECPLHIYRSAYHYLPHDNWSSKKQPIRSQVGLKIGCSNLELGLVVAPPSTSKLG